LVSKPWSPHFSLDFRIFYISNMFFKYNFPSNINAFEPILIQI
jgi:hypothetical protein